MKNLVKFAVILLFVIGGAFPAIAQNNANDTSNSGGNNANSNSGAAASVNNYYSSQSTGNRQFINALPGVDGAIFPGFPPGESPWVPYCPATFCGPDHALSIDLLDHIKGSCGKVRMVPLVRQTPPKHDDKPVVLIPWWPRAAMHPEDQEVGEATVVNKDYLQPDISCFAKVIRDLYKATGTHRIAMFQRALPKIITKGRSIGAGASAGYMTQKDNLPVGAAVGGMLGSNSVYREDPSEFMVIALNEGSPNPPENIRTNQREEQRPALAPTTVQPAAAIPVHVYVHVIPEQASAPAPAVAPSPAPVEAHELPTFTVYFAFDHPRDSELKDGLINPNYLDKVLQNPREYLGKIKEMADFLANHQGYVVQVEGHTDHVGSYAYNAGLGRRRAEVVYHQLLADNPSLKGRVLTQFVSVSKDRPASEYDRENRRVILRIIGPASGK